MSKIFMIGQLFHYRIQSASIYLPQTYRNFFRKILNYVFLYFLNMIQYVVENSILFQNFNFLLLK